jgi:hypothetical protein
VPFKNGNKAAPGGKRNGAGRPTKEKQGAKKLAAEIAREWFEENAVPILESYKKLIQFRTETRYTAEGKAYEVELIDAPSVRHAVDRMIPPAKQEIEISGSLTHKSNLPQEKA